MMKFVVKTLFISTLWGLFYTLAIAETQPVNFMQEAREYLDKTTDSIQQNQTHILKLNQFTAEGEFSAAELAETLFIRAVIFSRLDEFENAHESYAAAIKSNNLTPLLKANAYKYRALLSYRQKIYSDARDDFIAALDILAGNAELHYYLANSYLGLLNFELALFEYDQALEGMANNRFLAHFGKASVYYQQKLYILAEQQLKKCLTLRANFTPALNLLAEIEINEQAKQGVLKQSSNVNDETDGAKTTATANNKKPLTPNEIFNQLLMKAAAAKRLNEDVEQIEIKIDLNDDDTNIEVIEDNMPPMQGHQVSENPFTIEAQQQTQRLDVLLQPKLNGYFLQLSSNDNRKNAHANYDEMLKKHPLLLRKIPFLIREYKNENNVIIYQLLLSEFKSFKQANSLCILLKAQKADCFVRQIK